MRFITSRRGKPSMLPARTTGTRTSLHEGRGQRLRVGGVAVGQQVEAGHPQRLHAPPVGHDLGDRPLQDAGVAAHLAGEGEELRGLALHQPEHRIVVHGAHQVVEAAVQGQARPVQAFLLGQAHDLQEGGLALVLHVLHQALHVGLGQAHVLEPPERRGQVRALVEDLEGILDRFILVREHGDQLGRHRVLLDCARISAAAPARQRKGQGVTRRRQLAILLGLPAPHLRAPAQAVRRGLHDRVQHVQALVLQEAQLGAAGQEVGRAAAHLLLARRSGSRPARTAGPARSARPAPGPARISAATSAAAVP